MCSPPTLRARALIATILSASVSLAFSTSASASDDDLVVEDRPVATSCTPPIKCCRICTNGKACGNTCIAASKNCTKGRGCACDVADVCAEDP